MRKLNGRSYLADQFLKQQDQQSCSAEDDRPGRPARSGAQKATDPLFRGDNIGYPGNATHGQQPANGTQQWTPFAFGRSFSGRVIGRTIFVAYTRSGSPLVLNRLLRPGLLLRHKHTLYLFWGEFNGPEGLAPKVSNYNQSSRDRRVSQNIERTGSRPD